MPRIDSELLYRIHRPQLTSISAICIVGAAAINALLSSNNELKELVVDEYFIKLITEINLQIKFADNNNDYYAFLNDLEKTYSYDKKFFRKLVDVVKDTRAAIIYLKDIYIGLRDALNLASIHPHQIHALELIRKEIYELSDLQNRLNY